MVDYTLPLKEIRNVLSDVLNLEVILDLPVFSDCDEETFFAIADTFGLFAKEKLLPINKEGDINGPSLEAGQVTAAPGFAEAYQQFCTDGWNALPLEAEYGGQQLPFMLHAVAREAMAATNLAFALIHELNFGVFEALMACGSDALKDLYLPRLADGSWAGTMCLTEPHCGTDLGLIRTRAKLNNDDTYLLEGNKIFITWGDHHMSENIVHLVLARIEDAPPGVRGLSLFIVPKYIPDTEGNLGEKNNIQIVGMEEKMGLHGSPTCAISFEGAQGWLVGEEGRGLNAMFVMMNAARLSVGLQGLGIAEISYQAANAYAHERLQGRGLGERVEGASADPIAVHPDVRRRLLLMKAEIEAARALAYWGAKMLDEAHYHPDKIQKAQSQARLSALTPILKSYISELGMRFAQEAIQMHGGHGFIRDYGVEQLARDVRITAIYEGTNAIQAIDLVTRRVQGDKGEVLHTFIEDIRGEAQQAGLVLELEEASALLEEGAERLERVTQWLLEADAEASFAAASDYLDLTAITLSAMFSVKTARLAGPSQASYEPAYWEEKIASATLFLRRVLPKTIALEAALTAGPVGAAPSADLSVN